jgi:predicted nuclease with RNAse H fold
MRNEQAAILAVDAPLGWAAPLAKVLATHTAGGALAGDAHWLFRRETDRAIKRRLNQLPLDVGADRIARTAHAALSILNGLRTRLRVEMGWTPGIVENRQVIEVYPAATLRALGLPSRGYKRRDSQAVRSAIIDGLRETVFAPNARANAIESDHVLDAVICTRAGADYANGLAVAPRDLPLAKREGWIWAR